jgi:hypothetical protein
MQKLRIVTLGLGTGRQRWSLNDGQTTNACVVRVAPGAGYHRVEGNRRASRNGRVSDLRPPETPNRTIRNFLHRCRTLLSRAAAFRYPGLFPWRLGVELAKGMEPTHHARVLCGRGEQRDVGRQRQAYVQLRDAADAHRELLVAASPRRARGEGEGDVEREALRHGGRRDPRAHHHLRKKSLRIQWGISIGSLQFNRV